MDEKFFENFCYKATEKWGEESQLRMCIEEMSELTKEICKYMRIVKDHETSSEEDLMRIKNNIIEETADVLNCATQMALIFGKEKVDEIREYKVKRCIDKHFDK